MSSLGIVVIGRNEGERLVRCLQSVNATEHQLVYVDSGSTDGSVAAAREAGAEVVDLDMSIGFSAARARNAGFERLSMLAPEIKFVQFIDGDCEMMSGWLERGAAELALRPELAAVCGKLRERFPNASIYNRLCDMEWNRADGEIEACGGVAMYRAEFFAMEGGFNPTVIAGEEPELCVRFRRHGWKIVRIDAEMTLHDAAMTQFGQWGWRAVRAGHAYAEGAWLHGASPQRHNLRPLMSSLFWAIIYPTFVIAVSMATRGIGAALLFAYLLLWIRIMWSRRRFGDTSEDARLYATFCVLSKFAQLCGILKFVFDHWLLRHNGKLIEYKQAAMTGH